MSSRVETTEQEKQVLLYVRGAALKFTQNRRTVLAVFLAGTGRSPVGPGRVGVSGGQLSYLTYFHDLR